VPGQPLSNRLRIASTRIGREVNRAEKNAAAVEQARLRRLREDARRPISVNLAETIALSHELMKLAAAAKRA
jgi:hypothetical protein